MAPKRKADPPAPQQDKKSKAAPAASADASSFAASTAAAHADAEGRTNSTVRCLVTAEEIGTDNNNKLFESEQVRVGEYVEYSMRCKPSTAVALVEAVFGLSSSLKRVSEVWDESSQQLVWTFAPKRQTCVHGWLSIRNSDRVTSHHLRTNEYLKAVRTMKDSFSAIKLASDKESAIQTAMNRAAAAEQAKEAVRQPPEHNWFRVQIDTGASVSLVDPIVALTAELDRVFDDENRWRLKTVGGVNVEVYEAALSAIGRTVDRQTVAVRTGAGILGRLDMANLHVTVADKSFRADTSEPRG